MSKEQLEAAFCWEAEDHVAGRPDMTAFRRAARHHQARWREAHGHPIGTQPIAPKPGATLVRQVGSRLPLEYALDTGANFLTPAALAAARHRAAHPEAHQTLDHQRLWADLLSSAALSFNVFGDLAADTSLANRSVQSWFPDAPGRVSDVRFVHSPGRFDRAYLNSLRSFATAVVLDIGDGRRGIVAVDTLYHEKNKAELPRPENLTRYIEVADRSGVFAPGAIETLSGRSDLCVMWLEHLLMLSMLQHASGSWTWGRFIVVHPAGNTDAADLCARYRSTLVDDSTFTATTLEALLDTDALPHPTIEALRDRYLFSPM